MDRTGVQVRRSPTGAVVVIAVIAALVTSCTAPSGGGTVTQGTYGGEYSITSSPVTWFYDGVAGQDLNLFATDNRTGETSTPSLSLAAPGGAVVPVAERRGSYTQRYLLPVTGRYTIRLQYPDVDTFVRRFYLAVSRDEDHGPVGLGPLGPVIIGQRVTVHFDGSAGERLNRFGVDRITGPDGQPVADNGVRSGQVTLPVSGRYDLEFARSDAVLSHDLAPMPATLGGTTLPDLVSGQHLDLLYPGTSGEALGLAAPFSSSTLELRTFDDAPLATGVRNVLPASGTYRVVVTRRSAGTTPATVWLSHDLDLGVLGEGSWPTASRVPGQSITAAWSGVAVESFRIRTLDPPGLKPTVRVTAPDGTALVGVLDPASPSSSDSWTIFTPNVTGSHGILVTPRSTEDSGLITVELDALP